jgi:hypothetical protein
VSTGCWKPEDRFMKCQGIASYRMNKRDKWFSGFFLPSVWLAGFHLFNRSAALFEKNTVTTIRTPDVYVNFNFLLAPCTFIRTSHKILSYPLICSRVRSIARWATFIAGVCGWYAPPANL